MNGIYTFRQSDAFSLNVELNGATALDCSCDGKSLVLADSTGYIRVDIETGAAEKKKRHSHKIVRILKSHPNSNSIFAAIAGSNIEFWQNLNMIEMVGKIARVTDFDFHYFNNNLSVVSSSESVIFVDSREPKKLTDRLPLLFGSKQTKFSPANEHLLFTSNASDVRCFDIRNTKAPCRQFAASNHERIVNSLSLHPTDSNILVTSSMSETKLWSINMENVQSHQLDHSNIGKFVFSQSGELFAGLTYPIANRLETTVKLWQISAIGSAQELRQGAVEFVDLCWKKKEPQNHCLFTLSKNNTLFKNLAVSSIQSETPTMIKPIKQTIEDEHLDQLVLTNPTKNKEQQSRNTQPTTGSKPKNAQTTEAFILDSNSKSWNCWFQAHSISNQQEETSDLLFELDCIRKLNILGLACNEINFQRAAVGLSYSHLGIYKKFIIEIRFHQKFVENGYVFIELLKKDSPLTSNFAKSLLCQISAEAEKEQRKYSKTSVLSRALKQLPLIVESIHLFPTVNHDVLDQHRLSLAVNDDSAEKVNVNDKESQCSVGYTTSPFDSFVPSPRINSARFNQNGVLCLFGQAECMFNLVSNNRNDEHRKNIQSSRSLFNKNLISKRTMTPQEEQPLKRPSRLFFNRNENVQPFMRTLSDYHSLATQFNERNVHDLPETNHSFTMFNPTETRSELETETRRRISSVTLEDSTSMSNIKSSKSTILSPIRRRRGISMNSCFTADSFPVENQPTNSVTVLDTTVFQNVSRLLGQHYRLLGGSSAQICYHNIWVVVRYAPIKRELISLWQMLFEFFNSQEENQLNMMLNENCNVINDRAHIMPKKQSKSKKSSTKTKMSVSKLSHLPTINFHPLDHRFIFNFIEYFYEKFDIQTSSVLSCILMHAIDNELNANKKALEKKNDGQVGKVNKGSVFDRYILMHKTKDSEKTAEQILLYKKLREYRSTKNFIEMNYSDTSLNNSKANSLEHNETFTSNMEKNVSTIQEDENPESESNLQLTTTYEPYLTLENYQLGIDPILNRKLQKICLEYSTFLYQWGFLNQRAELLKCAKLYNNESQFKQLIQCPTCNNTNFDGFCSKCKTGSMICIVCDEECKGLMTLCKLCGHGGHASHIAEYFETFEMCPICGCRCR